MELQSRKEEGKRRKRRERERERDVIHHCNGVIYVFTGYLLTCKLPSLFWKGFACVSGRVSLCCWWERREWERLPLSTTWHSSWVCVSSKGGGGGGGESESCILIAGVKLVVMNMSQQTDSTDLLGG